MEKAHWKHITDEAVFRSLKQDGRPNKPSQYQPRYFIAPEGLEKKAIDALRLTHDKEQTSLAQANHDLRKEHEKDFAQAKVKAELYQFGSAKTQAFSEVVETLHDDYRSAFHVV